MISIDSVIGFIETKKRLLIIICTVVLVLLLLMLVIVLFIEDSKKKEKLRSELALKALSLAPGELWLPSEPLPVPGVQFFREPGRSWNAEEVNKWYTVPDKDSFDVLRDAKDKLIDTLLESVP